MKSLIDKLKETKTLTKEEWITLIEKRTPNLAEYLFEQAREVREEHYGKDIYIRGLIEFTNYCKNDCYYCGIRRSNQNALRYRLNKEEILSALNPDNLCGRSKNQVTDFIENQVNPILEKYKEYLDTDMGEVNV